jgi:O-antigen ligase
VAFLFTWQVIVPTAVRERVTMTETSSGHLEASANERVKLWTAAEDSILSNPILGTGFATYQYTNHVDNLRDTHNWYVKVMVETGIVGMIIVVIMLQQMLSLGYRLFKRAEDPMYRGLGLGLFLAIWACIIANCFGDRWTYLEITGPLWVLVGTAICATHMPESKPATELTADASAAINPYLVYR